MMEKINKQRKEYLNWDQYFMGVAKLSALRSKDPSTQVGACIVGDDNRILSIGYNGLCRANMSYLDHRITFDFTDTTAEAKP